MFHVCQGYLRIVINHDVIIISLQIVATKLFYQLVICKARPVSSHDIQTTQWSVYYCIEDKCHWVKVSR